MLEAVINPAGFVSAFSLSGEDALRRYKDEGFDVVLADIAMQPMDGITLLKELKSYDSQAKVILMTGYASTESAMQALKYGAFDYVQKPFRVEELVKSLHRAIDEQNASNADRATHIVEAVSTINVADVLVGKSEAIKAVERQVKKLVQSHAHVLITGERGTGKRALAELLHREGSTAEGVFKGIDCKVAYEDELSFRLFNSEGGPGPLIEEVQGGTLFLNNVESLPIDLQEQLGRVVQVSGSSFRLICASILNIESHMEAGRFSDELYFRISTLPLSLPPVRERREDIPLIIKDLLENSANPWFSGKQLEFSREAERILTNYPWPGNVTELNNVLCAVIAASGGRTIEAKDLPRRVKEITTWPSLENYLADRQESYIRELLKICDNDAAKAARIAKVDASFFDYYLDNEKA